MTGAGTHDARPRDADQAAASDVASANAELFERLGRLTYAWSNDESLLIYVIGALLGCDEVGAAIVFATLNTTRARITAVERLAKARIRDRGLARELSRLLARFDDATRVRNAFNHSMFGTDASGRITRTQSMRVDDKPRGISFGQSRPIDAARLDELNSAIRELERLNRDLWAILPKLQDRLADAPNRGKPR